ncbi:MAG: methionine gamma-lyase family protein [Vampirovibrionales bacterium]
MSRQHGAGTEAFVAHGLDEHHFASVTGYAHHDAGRQVTDAIYASVFGAEAALVRLQFVSGTHAIVCGLRGLLAPGQQIVSITGPPYDTLQTALGINHRASSKQSPMALTRQGFGYQQIDCFEGSTFEATLPPPSKPLLPKAMWLLSSEAGDMPCARRWVSAIFVG